MTETTSQVSTEETKKNEDLQKENFLRQILLKQVTEKYVSLVNTVRELPLFPQAYLDGLKKLDFGMLWLKEAITFSPIVMPQAQPNIASQTDNGAVLDSAV
jgi:hypothetical protein